jgi:uncharacterized RDD family membrane protein YckC
MFCSKCGAQNADGTVFCTACGQVIRGAGVAQAGANPGSYAPTGGAASYSPEGTPAAFARPTVAYAGFWLRLVALIIDVIVLSMVRTLIFLPFGIGIGMRGLMHGRPQDISEFAPFFVMAARLALLSFVLQWLYFSLMESSAWQATLGKKALGLEVTDLEGRRISFGRATGRYFGKILSALTLFIGFLMAGFTEKKQALHDMLAGTLVLRKL